MHSLSNWTLAVLLILTFSGFRFVKAKRIGVSVITMQMGKPNKQWTDQNGLSLNPYFSFNPLCHRLLVVLKSVNNDLKDSVLGCRNQTGSGAEITMSIYIAVSPTGLQLDSQNKCIRAERKKLLNEWKEAVSQNFEISSNLIHVQLEKKTFYIQAQNMHAYLLQEGSTFSSWFYSWKIKYQEAVCTTMTHLLNKLDKLYPFIHITMETKKGSVYLYVDIDLLFDVTEIGEMKTGDVVSLSNTESARYKQKLTLGSFEYQAPKHLGKS
ncbi:hypothetical protein D915_010317 [Fasciola hepatica]|uniref:Uncharacterized protein n=1 Tax=Fasciola hepatica TaxID=6192 RepID=A0A4E0QVG2_FASHE|nr:hypothetical protein D915_010317 [Fasciola hepatica]